MIPTKAGIVYLEAAKQMLTLRQSTYAHLEDLAECVSGTYQVGLTFDHGSDIFARIYPQFHQNYSGIQMRCYQMLVPEMLEALANNQLDLAFILGGSPEAYPESYRNVEYISLSAENLLLGLHVTHPLARNCKPSDYPIDTIDLDLVKNDSFAIALKKSTMRSELIDPMFEKAGYMPNIMIESSCNGFLEQLAVMGVCDTIIPQSRVRNRSDIIWFFLPGYPRFQFGVAYPKGYRLNRALENFISLARLDAMHFLHFPEPPLRPNSFTNRLSRNANEF